MADRWIKTDGTAFDGYIADITTVVNAADAGAPKTAALNALTAIAALPTAAAGAVVGELNANRHRSKMSFKSPTGFLSGLKLAFIWGNGSTDKTIG